MKLGKAIEILQLEETGEFDGNIHDYNDAIRLGIEALKHYQETRPAPVSRFYPLLPGETEK